LSLPMLGVVSTLVPMLANPVLPRYMVEVIFGEERGRIITRDRTETETETEMEIY